MVVRKQAKKEKRRQKKEEERRDCERRITAQRLREQYEEMVWKLLHRPWSFMETPESGLTPKETQLLHLMACGKSDHDIAVDIGLKENSDRFARIDDN